jgi:hypothetical protein
MQLQGMRCVFLLCQYVTGLTAQQPVQQMPLLAGLCCSSSRITCYQMLHSTATLLIHTGEFLIYRRH